MNHQEEPVETVWAGKYIEAKRKGRNRIALDEGSGPTFAEAPQFQVTGQIIEVEDAPTG